MGDRNHHTDGLEDPTSDDQQDEGHDRGASLVEYVLLISLIALVCVVAIGYFQDETAASFSRSASAVSTAGQG